MISQERVRNSTAQHIVDVPDRNIQEDLFRDPSHCARCGVGTLAFQVQEGNVQNELLDVLVRDFLDNDPPLTCDVCADSGLKGPSGRNHGPASNASGTMNPMHERATILAKEG